MPIVATLFIEGALTFADLNRRIAASRDTLTETLDDLEANGILRRSGDGRARAFELTANGKAVGAACLTAVGVVRESQTLDVALKKWPMLALVAMARGAGRFGELMDALPGVTPRALAQALKDLEGEQLATREVIAGYPPVTAYALTDRGWSIQPAMEGVVTACEALG